MCGINGFNFKDINIIKLMNKTLNHRGPDENGFHENNNLTLGQVRLSIVDLTISGHQPMFYNKELGSCNEIFKSKNIDNSKLSIVFNGEIYNYLELKNSLKKKGYNFTSKSDTEVILASYLEYGENCVNNFNGMWSFVIHDIEKNILFCSRDRLGVKPFYYYYKNNKFIFSSELKSILVHNTLRLNTKSNLNAEAVEFYFSVGFIPGHRTIYNDVFKLESSTNLIFNLQTNNIEKKYKYYEIPDYKPINDKKKLIIQGRKILENSVKIRMRSDVPVGAFLSGGLDSSSVVAEMKKFTDVKQLHTFSVGFEGKKYDETPYINIVKDYLGTNHHHEYFNENDFKNVIDKFANSYDEPFWDYSSLPTYFISKKASEYVTVVLSGDGGDEIFGGYNSHLLGARLDFLKRFPKILRRFGSKIPAKKNLNSFMSLYLLKEAAKLSMESPNEFYIRALKNQKYIPESFSKWSKTNLSFSLSKGDNHLSEGLRIYDLIYNTLSDNFLVKVDRASMANSIEIRSPFLDYRFIEFAQTIPSKWKVDILTTKKLMREIIKNILPNEIVNRGKQGFNPPLREWLVKKEYTEYINSKLIEIYKQNIINDEIYNFYSEKVLLGNNNLYSEYKIKLFLFCKWYDRWLK